MRPTSLLDDAARLKGTSDVARPVWSVTTHQGELTARRLAITFVPMTGAAQLAAFIEPRIRLGGCVIAHTLRSTHLSTALR
jgi:hypothetical protein